MTITETFTLDFDVLSPDLSTVICSTANTDCSAFRPLFDLERPPQDNPPPSFNIQQFDLGGANTILSFTYGQSYNLTNLSDDYAFDVFLSYRAEASGLFRFRGRTGTGNLTWQQDLFNITEGLTGAGDAPELNLFPFTGDDSAPIPTNFDAQFPISFGVTYRANRSLLLAGRGQVVLDRYSYGVYEIQPYAVDGVFDDNLVVEEVLPIPEPSTAVLLLAGLAGIAFQKRFT